MRDKTILPTNLLDWPRVAPRLPEEKLILVGCWIGGGWMRSCGCGMLPLRPFAASLGFSPDSLQTGLLNLSACGVELLALDEATGEVFVTDWFRFHTFKSPVSISIVHRDIQKTVSESLKKLILEKSKTCLPTATRTRTRTSSSEAEEEVAASAEEKFASSAGAGGASQRRRKLKIHMTGVHVWTQEDLVDVDKMVETHGLDSTTKAAAKLEAAGVKPLPSRVVEELNNMEVISRARQGGARLDIVEAHLESDPEALATGTEMLAKIRTKQSTTQGATP